MRRSIVLASVLAATVAVVGACDTKTAAPNKPVMTPAPVATASPVASPVASPTATPANTTAKPGSTPEVKKLDDKAVNKDTKPMTKETPKAK